MGPKAMRYFIEEALREVKAGRPVKQAAAIAYSEAKEGKKPKGKKK